MEVWAWVHLKLHRIKVVSHYATREGIEEGERATKVVNLGGVGCSLDGRNHQELGEAFRLSI